MRVSKYIFFYHFQIYINFFFMILHRIFWIHLSFPWYLCLVRSTLHNPNLCLADKCKTSNARILVPAVASIASFFVIVAVLLLIFLAKKKRKFKGTWKRFLQYHSIVGSPGVQFWYMIHLIQVVANHHLLSQ